MHTKISEINKENVDPVKVDPGVNLVELIRKLYVGELKQADEGGRKLFGEVQKKQEEISYLQKLIQAINAAVSDKGELDLTHNTEIKQMLKESEERFGLKVNLEKQKYTAQEWQRLIENSKSIIEDGNAQVQLKLNEVNRVNNRLSEIIKIFDSVLKGLHRAAEEMIRGVK
jgi:hypothetical protein